MLAISAFLSLKHGWDAFQPANTKQTKMMADLGISKAAMPFLGAFSVLVGLMLLFPQTFFIGNVLNAVTIVLIMALSLRVGNVRMALIEIPFLAQTLLPTSQLKPLISQRKNVRFATQVRPLTIAILDTGLP